jgi:hypothetical protein
MARPVFTQNPVPVAPMATDVPFTEATGRTDTLPMMPRPPLDMPMIPHPDPLGVDRAALVDHYRRQLAAQTYSEPLPRQRPRRITRRRK